VHEIIVQRFPKIPPKLYDKPIIETINTWRRFKVALLHGLVQLLDGDVQLQVLLLFLRNTTTFNSRMVT
jgi:hypothetical protein